MNPDTLCKIRLTSDYRANKIQIRTHPSAKKRNIRTHPRANHQTHTNTP